jgi:hypothetical protein
MLEGHPPLLEEGNPPLELDGVAPMDCAALGDLVLTDEEAFGKSFGTVIPGGSPHANDASSQLEKDAEMMDIDDTQRAGGVEGGAGAGDTVPFRLVSEAASKHENVRQGVTAAAAENGRGEQSSKVSALFDALMPMRDPHIRMMLTIKEFERPGHCALRATRARAGIAFCVLEHRALPT